MSTLSATPVKEVSQDNHAPSPSMESPSMSAGDTSRVDTLIQGVLNDVEEVHFLAVPPLAEGRLHGTICSIRQELVDISKLPCLSLLMAEDVVDQLDIPSLPPLPAIIIERSVRGSSATIQHVYSRTPIPLRVLQESDANSPVAEEDIQVLRFSQEIAAPSSSGSGAKAAAHKRLRPLQSENAILRSALGLSRTQKIDTLVAQGAVQKLQEQYHAEKQAQAAVAAAAEMSIQRDQQQEEETPGVAAAAPGVQDLHSPLQWEMETEAAVNARTRYDPNRQKSGAGRRKQLDSVTQQQLVARLHDKSVDSRDKRRAENQDRIERELGHHERRVLSSDEQHNLAQRLHDAQQEHSKQVMQDAQLKAHGPPEEKKKFSADEQKASNERIYKQPRDKTKQEMEKLFNKYIVEEDAKYPKLRLSQEQQKAMGDRLCQKH